MIRSDRGSLINSRIAGFLFSSTGVQLGVVLAFFLGDLLGDAGISFLSCCARFNRASALVGEDGRCGVGSFSWIFLVGDEMFGRGARLECPLGINSPRDS